MTEQEQIYSIATATYSRVIKPFIDEEVLALKAVRSYYTESKKTTQAPPYWIIRIAQETSTNLDFHSQTHGAFRKRAIQETIKDFGLQDLQVHSLDFWFRDRKVSELIADEFEDKSFRGRQWVAHFEWYPASREPERAKFAQQIHEKVHGTKDTFCEYEPAPHGLGFQPAALDLDYVLPLQTWKEITRKGKQISQDYREQISNWRTHIRGNPTIMGAVLKAIYPDLGMRLDRRYTVTKDNVRKLTEMRFF